MSNRTLPTNETSIETDIIHYQSFQNNVVENAIIDFLLRHEFNFGVSLPCSKINKLISMLNRLQEFQFHSISREEEGVGICAGAYLAGKKPFMLIQSSGLGNSFNAIASLLITYEIPILILASYRGYYKEKIYAQVPLGNALPGMLESMKIPYIIIDSDFEKIEEFYKREFDGPHVVFLSPELFENV